MGWADQVLWAEQPPALVVSLGFSASGVGYGVCFRVEAWLCKGSFVVSIEHEVFCGGISLP